MYASLLGLAGLLETVGGLAIALGLFTRPVAFVLAGEMAVAYFMAHAPGGFMPILNGGELAILARGPISTGLLMLAGAAILLAVLSPAWGYVSARRRAARA